MASHGIPRQSSAVGKTEKERERERREIKEYKGLVDQVTERINAKDFSKESLDLTSKLLTKNPEYYTIWNHRRRILRHIIPDRNSKADDTNSINGIKDLISSDLSFILPLLIKFPKCYWIWNHRIWLLQQGSLRLPRESAQNLWQQDLNLVAEMLRRDSRNYHGWDYRRTIIAAIRKLEISESTPEPEANSEAAPTPAPQHTPSITEQEFAYTTKMVRSNLSNFSAWHNRSRLIPRLLAERAATPADRRALFDDELTFVTDALAVDPYDQSLWFYHHFLMSGLRPPSSNPSLAASSVETPSETSENESCFTLPAMALSPANCTQIIQDQIFLFREIVADEDNCKLLYQNLLDLTEMQLQMQRLVVLQEGKARAEVDKREMRTWLGRLRELDPMRVGRWEDLQARLQIESE